MRIGDIFGYAWVNLRRQKLRTALTVFAVFIGAFSVTTMLTLVTSAQEFATSQATANGQDRQIAVTSQPDVKFREALMGNGSNWGDSSSAFVLSDSIATQVAGLPGVAGVTKMLFPQVFDRATVNGSERRLEGAVAAYEPSPLVEHAMRAGRWVDDQNVTETIAISAAQSKAWGFSSPEQAVGQEVALVTRDWYQGTGSAEPPRGPGNQAPQQGPTTFTARITGVTDNGDDSVVYPSWTWAQQLATQREWSQAPNGQSTSTLTSLVARNGYGALLAVAEEPGEVARIARDVQRLGAGAAIAQDEVDNQKRAFRIIGFVLGGIGAIALLVAAIGVINTMVMSILERTREIGVMRAIGASRRVVRRLFTLEAALIGLFGGLVGVLVAYVAAFVANPIVNHQLADSGLSSRDIISVPPLLGLVVVVVTTVVGVVAGLLPASRAARMDPVAALRAE